MLAVAGPEFVELSLIVEQRFDAVRFGQRRFVDALQLAHEVHEGHGFRVYTAQGGTDGHVDLRVFRGDDLFRCQVEGLGELFPKLGQVGQRAAEEADCPLMGRPQARPVMVWKTMDWKTDAATFSLLAPSLSRAWMSVLAKTPQRAAMG